MSPSEQERRVGKSRRLSPVQNVFGDSRPALNVAVWFYRDFILRYPAKLFWITSLGLASALLQAAALVGIGYGVELLTSNKSVVPFSTGVAVESGQAAIYGGVFLLLTLGGAAVLTFMEGCAVLALWRRYQLHSLNALLANAHAAFRRGSATLAILREVSFRTILRQVVQLGAFSRVATASIAPALRFAAFSTYAIILNPLLTIALLASFLSVGGLTIFQFARRASRDSRSAISLASQEGQELDQHLSSIAEGEFIYHKADKWDSAINRRADAITSRFLWVEYAKFAASIVTIVVLISVYVVGSFQTVSTQDWAVTLTYFLALFLACRQLVAMASSFSTFGRFYPLIVQQKEMLAALQTARSPEELRKALSKSGSAGAAPLTDEELA